MLGGSREIWQSARRSSNASTFALRLSARGERKGNVSEREVEERDERNKGKAEKEES